MGHLRLPHRPERRVPPLRLYPPVTDQGVDSIDRGQIRTEASLTNAKKFAPSFPYRVATRRNCFRLVEETFGSIVLAIDHLLPAQLGFSVGAVDVGDGAVITDTDAHAVGVVVLVGNDDGTCSMPSSKGSACASRDRSTRTWIFVVRPPRLRSTQRSPLFSGPVACCCTGTINCRSSARCRRVPARWHPSADPRFQPCANG
jgi:hypothetical protein